jgi:hypothetical protein
MKTDSTNEGKSIMSDPIAPVPNIPLLRKAVEWAEAEAAKTDGPCMWNQAIWATPTDCGTTYCIAGYVCATTSDPRIVVSHEDVWPELYVDGEWAPWSETAQAQLGLTHDEAEALFLDAQDLPAVRAAAESIAARAGERL